MITIEIKYYYCTFCKRRHRETAEWYTPHLMFRDDRFGIHSVELILTEGGETNAT